MLKSIIKTLGFIACLASSGIVCAMGMGGINVTTALGEPLRAEIELVAVSKAERSGLSAHLASPDAFKGAGLDYPGGLPTLKFQIEMRANGEPYLKITSIQPINEPFVSLLVELSWTSGKLLREYTFLLDPPGYKAEQPNAAEVEPVTPSVQAPPSIVTAPLRATAPMAEKAFVEKAAPARDKKPAASGNIASGAINVKRGDTLSGIALHSKPSGVSLERMLVAMYRANEDAFDGNNMNRLKTGKILQMPKSQDFDKLAQVDAVKEIRVQVADWHAYRQKLAYASSAVAEHVSKRETSGKISTRVADKAPAAKESAKEVVRLSKGEAPGDKAVAAGDAKALQVKVHALEEEAIARSKALRESNERVALLEKNIKEMQHLIELKGQPAALTKPVLSKAEGPVPGKIEAPAEIKPAPKPEPVKAVVQPPTPTSSVAPASQPPAASAIAADAPASAVKPAKPAAKPAAPKEVPPPPSLLDDPLYMAGGAAVLLALGGVGFVLFKRGKLGKAKKKSPGSGKENVKDIGVTSAKISAPVAPSPETGDFTQAAAVAPISQVQPDDVDPINEADLFLSFGRDVQAEEILKDALEKSPANNQIRLKLLSIYAKRGDIKSFSAIARQVQDSGDTAAWAQAAEMGSNLEPNNPMYGGAGGKPASAAAADGKGGQQQAAGLDFDLGLGEPAATADTESTAVLGASAEKAAPAPAVDFDLGFDATAASSEPEVAKSASVSGLDFDLGLGEGSGLSATSSLASTKVFNAPPGEMSTDIAAETPMDFDITATHPLSAAPEPGQQDTSITPNMDDLVFDITSTNSYPSAITEEKPAADALGSPGEGMAFTLDFPTTEKAEPAPAQAAAKGDIDLDLSGLSLDLGEPTAPAPAPAEEVKDAHWHDVTTKLDLAKAYQEMGDNAGAREILEEVLAEGDDQQRAIAEEVLKQLLD